MLLWVIPDSGSSLSRWDRVSLIVSTRMGERLCVLRIAVSGEHCCVPWPCGRPTPIRGSHALCTVASPPDSPRASGAASRWLGHCLRLGTSKHGRVLGTSYFLKLFSRVGWLGTMPRKRSRMPVGASDPRSGMVGWSPEAVPGGCWVPVPGGGSPTAGTRPEAGAGSRFHLTPDLTPTPPPPSFPA